MAELLKNVYNQELLRSFGDKVCSVYNVFDAAGFINAVMDDTWDNLALKARMRRITEKLGIFLPERYEDALEILFAVSENCVGFPYLFFPDFVAVYGLAEEHFELSMKALEIFTQKSSSEFAVRPFLLRQPDKVICQMIKWAGHPNEHVRRLASEGCRPRLPWGESLPMFKKNPTPVLSVIELLKADPSLYVRKSVANNLNDIAKDHPTLVLETARRWQGVNPDTDWIIRRACRTLIRKADSEAFSLFGYAKSTIEAPLTTFASLSARPSRLQIGESCDLCYKLNIRQGEPMHIRVEYGIDFVKANGRASRKLFLLLDKTVNSGQCIEGSKKHDWSDLTTRRHYPGEHRIALLVNGQEVAFVVISLEK